MRFNIKPDKKLEIMAKRSIVSFCDFNELDSIKVLDIFKDYTARQIMDMGYNDIEKIINDELDKN